VVVVMMKRIALVLGFLLAWFATASSAQSGDARANQWFRVSWTPPTEGTTPTLAGQVFNGSPYRVTDVRLRVEGFGADQRRIGQIFTWALGDIDAGGESSFSVEAIPGAVSYRVDVVSFDLVSRERAP
jgi:hypothetical protein